jgi:hypothetical protein
VQDAQVQKLVQDVLSNKDFLAQNQLTADTTNLGEEDKQPPPGGQPDQPQAPQQPTQPWYQNARKLPILYRWMQRGPWLLSLLAMLIGVGVVFAASTKRKGLQHLAISLFMSSLLLALGAGLIWYFSAHMTTTSFFKPAEVTPATTSLQSSFVAIIKDAATSVASLQTIIALVLVGTSVAVLIALRLTRPPKNDSQSHTSDPIQAQAKPQSQI